MSGGNRVGPYQLEGQLGAGAMGAVWRARHLELGVCHALKLLRPELVRPDDTQRFQREVELLARVSHPGLVRIHASDVERGRVWYSMDLVEGEDLERKLVRGPLEPRLAARLVRDVARAVQALHARGVIHRDLKPANVVVDAQGLPRLVDMGLARAFTDESRRLTLTGELVGTPYYMAPEQARGAPIGPYSDVWGLGMVLYALLAGRPGVSGTSTAEVLEEVRAARVTALEKLAPATPRGLLAVVRRALAPDPVARYAGAGELAQALDDWLRSGAGERGSVSLAVGLGVLAVGGLSLLAVAIMLLRAPASPGGGAAPAPVGEAGRAPGSEATARARSRLGELEQASLRGAIPTAAELDALGPLRAALSAERAALPPEAAEQAAELVLLEGRLLIAEGELAVCAGDATRARARLGEVETLSDPRGGRSLRELRSDGAAGLRAGLAVIAPRAGSESRQDVMALLGDVTRLSEAAPQRPDLRAWRMALALRAGRAADAQAALDAAPDAAQLPPDLRAETLIAAGKVEQAEPLAPRLSRPVLGRLLWARTRRALELPLPDEGGLTDVLSLASEAMRTAPDAPERAPVLELTEQLLARARRWSRDDPPERLAPALVNEVAATRVRAALEPGWRLPDERVVAICQALIGAGPLLGGATVELLASLLEVAGDLGELYRLHAAAAVDWGLPDPRRDQALIRRGIERFRGREPDTVSYLQEQLAKAMDERQDLNGLLALAGELSEPDPARLRVTVLGRAANQLCRAGRLEEAGQRLAQARALGAGAPELDLYESALERGLWERTHDPAHKERALALAWTWLEGFTIEERSSWKGWLAPVCGWVALQEEADGRGERALQAIELLLRVCDDAPRWGAHRLALLVRQDPLPVEALKEGLPRLAASIEALGDELAAQAEACEARDPERNRRLRELAAGFHGLTQLRHLEEALTIENTGRLREGLLLLERRLSELDAKLEPLR